MNRNALISCSIGLCVCVLYASRWGLLPGVLGAALTVFTLRLLLPEDN